MSKFVFGSRVKVKRESTSPYHGCAGVVIKVISHEVADVYVVKMESYPDYLPQSNRFMDQDLEAC